MSFTGHVLNGQVVLDAPLPLADGALVEVAVREALRTDVASSNAPTPTHYEIFKDIIGCIPDLPEDFADQHDHYIHGTPKR
jgi:hypothetical protein